MKVSLNWLKDYLPIELSPDKIGEILTDIGLEVEGMEQVESIKGGLEGLVIGEVVTCIKHPNADKLKLTTVNIGAEENLSIVCGAPNVDAGQKVVVATVGTMLYPIEGDPFKIKKGKIRGEVSEGMICAEDEIGIGTSHAGIIVLPENVAAGTLAKDYYEISNDVVYDIGLTPNRSDATGHIGVAEDLAAYLKVNESLKSDVNHPDISNFFVENTTLPFKVELVDEKACPRYSGVTISGIEVKQSPQWLKDRLNAIGVRPISNIVDITNFILHEYGQPLHAFDADKIAGQKLIIDTLDDGTKFTTLDEKERALHGEDLMICDGNRDGLCIAGVFGGIGSGVTDTTKNIFLESAHFEAGSIRRTSTRHLLRTDAAKVFEKGSNPNINVIALKRACLLIKELAGGTISSEINDEYPTEIKPIEIHLHYKKVTQMMGVEIAKDDIHNILQAMNMGMKPVNDDSILVSVPTNKADVIREADLIEEILRIYGFNKVPIPTKIQSTVTHLPYPSKNKVKSIIAEFLASNGFNEMMGLSLIEESQNFEELNIDPEKLVYINNTSNIHLNIMRPEPMVSGLISVVHNQNYQQKNLSLFEFGKSYLKADEGFDEHEFISLFMTGFTEEHWSTGPEKSTDIFQIKKSVQWILNRLNISTYQTSELEDSRFEYGIQFHRGNKNIVKFGEVKESILEKMGIKSAVFYAEFDLKNLHVFTSKAKSSINEVSRFPAMKRDLALVLDEAVKFSQIESITKKIKSKILTDVSLFDIYKSKEHLGEGKKSYAIKLHFQDKENTLKDKMVDKDINRLIDTFENELGAIIRK